MRIQRGEEGSAGLLGRGVFERVNGIIAMLKWGLLCDWDENVMKEMEVWAR